MQTLEVDLGARSYPIHIGENLLGKTDLFARVFAQPSVAVVTNFTVAPLYLDPLLAGLHAAGIKTLPIILKDGEQYKNAETLNEIYDALLKNRCERKTTLIALGGGVIGDLTGYAAATYLRGVPFIQIPTTLLAQVDSSVGGKTGINHPLGKNMIGAFYQPRAVVADIATLRTLPARELSAGLAEVIKYGLIRDTQFFSWLEVNMERLIACDAQTLAYAVSISCRNKAELVAADEREGGVRALLNLGHTFGHAIETGMGYGNWLHGEAVTAGTMLAARLSERLGWLNTASVARIGALFERAGLPTQAPDLGESRYLEMMQLDKKVEDGKLRLILLKGIGQGVIASDVATADIAAVLPPALHA